MRVPIVPTIVLLAALVPAVAGQDGGKSDAGKPDAGKPDAGKKASDAVKEIAGTAEFLKAVPKKFATLQGWDSTGSAVTLLCDGEKEAQRWPLTADAEIKVMGWWGRPEQCKAGDRVWCWFKLDRAKKPVAVFMLADELSEQDIHGAGLPVKSFGDGKLVVTLAKDRDRAFTARDWSFFKKNAKSAEPPQPKERVYVRRYAAEGDFQCEVMDEATFVPRRSAQKDWLRQQWLKQGLPASMGIIHLYSGEADVIVDHEALRWVRSLRAGDKVELAATPPIAAVVKHVAPQREKTQVRLVAKSLDLADLSTGQRVRLLMKAPTAAVDDDAFPPDLDRPRSKEERIEWFLASVYCTCGVGGDVCTGHFYTLSNCNPNGCGAPGAMRKLLAKKIDEGLTDRQIFEQLAEQRGPLLLRPHLLP